MPTAGIGALVLALLLPVLPAASLSAEAAEDPREAAAQVLPAFAAEDLDGRAWTAQDLRGRVVLLDFWATWCAPCLAELPRLRQLRTRYARGDFEILGISLDVASRRAFISWLNRNRIDWPQIHERAGYGGRTARLFAIDRLPRTVLVARDGRVAAVDLRGPGLARAIDRLVAERTPVAGPSTGKDGR